MKVWYPVHSQINLKNCSFYILDGGGGFTHIGHVNGNQSAGLTGVDLTSVTSAEVAKGDLIAFETNPTHRYLVKGFATNIVTIAPALVEALSAGDEVYVIHNPENIEIKIGEGDLTYTEHHARTYTKDRGRLDTVRDADEEPMDVAFQFTWEWIRSKSGDIVPTIEEALKQQGIASDWMSSSADACEPYCVDILVVNAPECLADNEVIILSQFRYETLEHSVKNGTVSCTGKCNVTEALAARNMTLSAITD